MTLIQMLAAQPPALPITILKTAANSWGTNQISVMVTADGIWGVGFSCVCLPRATAALGVRFVKFTNLTPSAGTEITKRIRQFRMMPTMEREIYLPFVTGSLLNNDLIGVQFYADGADVSLTDLRLHVFR